MGRRLPRIIAKIDYRPRAAGAVVVHGGPARSVCAALCMCAALQLVGEAALAMGAALRDEDAAVPLSGLWPPAEGLRAGVDVGEWLAGACCVYAPTSVPLAGRLFCRRPSFCFFARVQIRPAGAIGGWCTFIHFHTSGLIRGWVCMAASRRKDASLSEAELETMRRSCFHVLGFDVMFCQDEPSEKAKAGPKRRAADRGRAEPAAAGWEEEGAAHTPQAQAGATAKPEPPR